MRQIGMRDGVEWFELMAPAGAAVTRSLYLPPGRTRTRIELLDAEVVALGYRSGLQVKEWDCASGTLWMRGPKVRGVRWKAALGLGER